MRLIRLKQDSYMVVKNNRSYFGNIREVYKLMASWDVKAEEITAGFRALEVKGDDIADYGINRTLIFSKKMTSRDEFLPKEYN